MHLGSGFIVQGLGFRVFRELPKSGRRPGKKFSQGPYIVTLYTMAISTENLICVSTLVDLGQFLFVFCFYKLWQQLLRFVVRKWTLDFFSTGAIGDTQVTVSLDGKVFCSLSRSLSRSH